MAKNKKLSKAVRERMARTGETYSTARMHILAKLGGDEPALARVLTAWVPDPNPRMPKGTLARFLQETTDNLVEAKPLIVLPMGWRWKILLPGNTEAAIQGRFAAPTAEIACAYADDYLCSLGYTGPGVRPLPSKYPPLHLRTNEMIPTRSTSPFDRGVLVEAARCECGYVGEDIVNRHDRCPSCGGCGILRAEMLTTEGVEAVL